MHSNIFSSRISHESATIILNPCHLSFYLSMKRCKTRKWSAMNRIPLGIHFQYATGFAIAFEQIGSILSISFYRKYLVLNEKNLFWVSNTWFKNNSLTILKTTDLCRKLKFFIYIQNFLIHLKILSFVYNYKLK